MVVKDVSIVLNEMEWEHILELIEDDVSGGNGMFITRYNLQIYDKIYKCLEKADEENDVNE